MTLRTRTVLAAAALLAAATPLAAQQDRVVDLLKEISEAPGPSGLEGPVRDLVVKRMQPYADDIRYDGLGSVIATQGSSGPRVMLDAHLDELGGMVRRVTRDGYLSMQMLGGWFDQALVDQRWIIMGSRGPVHAVTGIRDIHVVPSSERNRVFPRESLFLDVGARSAAEVAELGIEPGDAVVPDAPFQELNGTGRYMGKAWDDRVGMAVLLEVMRRLDDQVHPNQMFYAATVQEEVGLRGAHTAAEVVQPEVGIALEGGVSGDVPGARPEETQARLGGGPGIFLYDSSQMPNQALVDLVKKVAADNGIPLQLDLVQGYGDDSAEIQKCCGGVPTVNLVVPVRYTHAHNGVMDRKDFDRTVDLVVALLRALDAETVARLRDFSPR
ncbi:MAG: M42 family metallopeptidase [Gemmatimonadota bacterium]|jgi:endoglucanase